MNTEFETAVTSGPTGEPEFEPNSGLSVKAFAVNTSRALLKKPDGIAADLGREAGEKCGVRVPIWEG